MLPVLVVKVDVIRRGPRRYRMVSPLRPCPVRPERARTSRARTTISRVYSLGVTSVFLLLTLDNSTPTPTHVRDTEYVLPSYVSSCLLSLVLATCPIFPLPRPRPVSPGAARTSTREDAEPPHTRCTARHDTPADMDTRHIIRIRALSLRERGQGYVRRVSPSHRPVLLELNISPQPAFTHRHARLLPSNPLDAAS